MYTIFTTEELHTQDRLFMEANKKLKDRQTILRGLQMLNGVQFDVPQVLMDLEILEQSHVSTGLEVDTFNYTVTTVRKTLHDGLRKVTKESFSAINHLLHSLYPAKGTAFDEKGHIRLERRITQFLNVNEKHGHVAKYGLFLDYSTQVRKLDSSLEEISLRGACKFDAFGVEVDIQNRGAALALSYETVKTGVTELALEANTWHVDFIKGGIDVPTEAYANIRDLMVKGHNLPFSRANSILSILEKTLPFMMEHISAHKYYSVNSNFNDG